MQPKANYCAARGCKDFGCWGYKTGNNMLWFCSTHRRAHEDSLNLPLPELKAAQGSLL